MERKFLRSICVPIDLLALRKILDSTRASARRSPPVRHAKHVFVFMYLALCYKQLGAPVKTKPIGIRFEQEEYEKIERYARKNGLTFSDVVREGALSLVDPDRSKKYRSLAQLAHEGAPDMTLAFSQFLDDFSHASDRQALIADEPSWNTASGRWFYGFAATAHKLAHGNHLPAPSWVLKDEYVAPEPLYAHDTKNLEFQKHLRETTPREFQWHNLFLGENILSRA